MPDIVVTSEPDGEGLVPLASARLLVEVADRSLAYDRDKKAGLYATNGVPEYWLADVRAQSIHQHWAPANGVYTERRSVKSGERLDAATIPTLSLETTGL